MRKFDLRWVAMVILTVVSLGGCAGGGGIDPWEKTNRFFYQLNDGIDKYALKPAADGYVKVVPQPIRDGLDNAFNNLDYFNVILNDFLQAKWEQGCSDSGRMAVNSTLGIAGLFDIATQWKLVAHDNDFGITLGTWGAKPGPYLVLPFFGPSTVRDSPSIPVEILCDPTVWLGPPLAVSAGMFTAEAIDARANAAGAFRFRDAAAIDPYSFTRNAYLQYRANQIREGKPAPEENLYDEDTGPASAPATRPATAPAAPATAGKVAR